MLNKLFAVIVLALGISGLAWADVDVNKADQVALESVAGLGPALSKKILDARQKGGNFRDWNDLQARVDGIKEKSALRLSRAGLTVDGKSMGEAKPMAENRPARAGRDGAVRREVAPAGAKLTP